MVSSSYDNGVSQMHSYNADNTLAGITYNGAPIGGLLYSWDVNKNKLSETIGGVMNGYGFTATYDAENRLVSWDRSDNNRDQAWDLSPVGDWNSTTDNGSTQNRTHGPAHELVCDAGQSLQHDAKGNMIFLPSSLRSQALALTWDFDNRLANADVGNDGIADVAYKFDALGRRVVRSDSSTDIVYVQSGQQTVADYLSGASPNSPTYIYLYGEYIDEVVLRFSNSGSIYYHRNQQYSVIALTDEVGSIVERYTYDAYGLMTNLTASATAHTAGLVNNRHTYTGREWDEQLAMYHFRARMYDPTAGRFCSRDPIGFKSSQWNVYSYLCENPHSKTDPTGMYGGIFPPPTPNLPCMNPLTGRPCNEPIKPSYRNLLPKPETSGQGCCNGKSIDYSKTCCVSCGDSGPIAISRSSKVTVSVCFRTAQLFGGGAGRYIFGAFHMWLKTPCAEVGLGELGGGVPGVDEPSGSPTPYPMTSINPHNGQSEQPGSFCVDLELNYCCIAAEMRERPMGEQCGPGYNCNTYVDESLKNCGVTNDQLKDLYDRSGKRDPDRNNGSGLPWPFGLGPPI